MLDEERHALRVTMNNLIPEYCNLLWAILSRTFLKNCA